MSAGTTPPIDADDAATILQPEGSSEGYWVGAPSVHGADAGTYLAVRKRTPQNRGHTLVIYERTGTLTYEPVVEFEAADFGAVSLERPALLTDPETGAWKLYLSADQGSNQWSILKLEDVTSPQSFDSGTANVVLEPRPGTTDGETVKDPYVLHHGDRYYMFYAGYDGQSEQAHLATSADGESWSRAAANPVLGRGYWHDFHTRITCIVPAPDGADWLVFYDGSGTEDYQNTWNLRTGVAVSADLTTISDVTTSGPAYAAPAPDGQSAAGRYQTFRYVDILASDNQWTVFYEAARDDDAFELRQTTVTFDG